MESGELQRKLLAAARSMPADERMPYAFEKRVMARIEACSASGNVVQWARALWQAAASCAAIMLLLVSWSVFFSGSSNSARDFSEDLENTVLAALDSDQTVDAHW